MSEILKMCVDLHVKYPLFFVRLEGQFNFLYRFSKKSEISNSIKIRSVESEFFNANRRTDARKDKKT